MTSALEFTYLYNGFSLSVNENSLNRAVRVKTAVRDKIKRIFESKNVTINNSDVSTTGESVQTYEKESLIDLSHDKLLDLNAAMNELEEQKNVSYTVNRAVLFTQPLVAKINRVSAKWFDGMPRVEKKIEIPTTDMPSVNMVNHLGGEVVPGNWSNVVEKEEVENTPLSLEPTFERVPTLEPVPEVTLNEQPENQVEFNFAPQGEVATVNVEIPTVSENTDIYRFPTFDFNMESLTPTVPKEEVTENANTSFDFVPEPNTIEEEKEPNYVSEPTPIASDKTSFAFEMPALDAVVPIVNIEEKQENEPVAATEEVNNSPMEDKIGELLNREFTPNPANNFVPEHVDNRPAEVKIDEVLGRNKTAEIPSIESTNEEPVVTNAKEEKPTITQGQIIARLRRFNNEMAEKDATIKSLTAKNDTLKDEVATNKDKVAEYELKVTDLTSKNTDLASQNERLSSKLEEVETSSRTTISKLEAKVDELTHARTDEIESLRKQIEELKTKHASEIASMNEKHSAEIKLVNESKDKQIQAIYSTISEALGETPVEDDYTRSKAA